MHQNNVEQWILPKNGEDIIFKDGRFCTVFVNSKLNTNKETTSILLKCDATSKQYPLKLYDTHVVYYMQPLYKGFAL